MKEDYIEIKDCGRTAGQLATVESNLKIAKVSAKVKRTENQDESDINYDMQVLRNRALSYMDEVLTILWLVVVSVWHVRYFS